MKSRTSVGLLGMLGILANTTACWRTDVYAVTPDGGTNASSGGTGIGGATGEGGSSGAVPSAGCGKTDDHVRGGPESGSECG